MTSTHTYGFTVGDMTVHGIVELEHPFLPALEMLPDLQPETLDANRHWLQPAHLTVEDVFVLRYQSYIVTTPHHTILIDSCLGAQKERSRPEWRMRSEERFLSGLASLGLSVDDIDYVMCTHLHVDHVGWNTRLINGRWVPTFPKARYLFGEVEFNDISDRATLEQHPEIFDSVMPVVEARRCDLIANEFQLGDHLRIAPTPGHTKGHMSFIFGKERDRLAMTGDLLHVALQMKHPELSFIRDSDQLLAAATRRAFLDHYCDTDTVCCTSHFPVHSAGRIRRLGEGFRLDTSLFS